MKESKEDRVEEIYAWEGKGFRGSQFVGGVYCQGETIVRKDDCRLVAGALIETRACQADRIGTCLDCGDKVWAGDFVSTVVRVERVGALSSEEEAVLAGVLKDLTRSRRWRSKCSCIR